MKHYEDMTPEEQIEYMIKLNKYAEKCKKINSVTCYETDREVADSLRELEEKQNKDKEDENTL